MTLAVLSLLLLYGLFTFALYLGCVTSFFDSNDRRNDSFPHVWSLICAVFFPLGVVYLAFWWGGKLLQRMWK